MREKAWFNIFKYNNEYNLGLFFNPVGDSQHGRIELNEDEDLLDFYLNLSRLDDNIYTAKRKGDDDIIKMLKLFNKKAKDDGLIAQYVINTKAQLKDICTYDPNKRKSGILRAIRNALHNEELIHFDNFPIKRLNKDSEDFEKCGVYLIIPIEKEVIQTSLDDYKTKELKQSSITSYI